MGLLCSVYTACREPNSIFTQRNDISIDRKNFHVTDFSDLVDLWVIKIKKPMILCARSTPRSREQSTKRRSLLYSQNNKNL